MVKTDLGYINQANANYLYTLGFITSSGGVIGRTNLYEQYAFSILVDIKTYILDKMKASLPQNLTLDDDAVIDVMRTGGYEQPYKLYGIEYVYKFNRSFTINTTREIMQEYYKARENVVTKTDKKYSKRLDNIL